MKNRNMEKLIMERCFSEHYILEKKEERDEQHLGNE